MQSPNVGGISPQPTVVGCTEEDEEVESAAQKLLRELLARQPSKLASWALEQARGLAAASAELEQTEAFQLAAALREASPEERKALARKAVTGLGELPPHRRAEAVRLAMQATDVAQRVSGPGVRQLLAEHGGAVPELQGGGAGDPDKDAPPPPPPPPTFGGASSSSGERCPQDGEAVSEAAPLVRNLLILAGEAKLSELPQGELKELVDEVKVEAAHLVEPTQLVDVVLELGPDEREQLTDALVEVKVFPEEQRGLLQEAVRPGGYADRLASVMRLLGRARKRMWIFALLPAAELLLALLLGGLSCGTSLLAWLRGDSILALGQVGALYFAYYTLAPVYREVQCDIVGLVQRWRAAGQQQDFWKRLEDTVPGVDPEVWRMGGASILVFALFTVVGAFWMFLGILELMGTMAYGCSSVVLFFCNLLIGIRLTVVSTLLVLVALRIWSGSPRPASSPRGTHEGSLSV
uniref:Uncharacterized protein n=1 Tax=Alexandrium monilatum TaxID=311494 RepID=A0A7S4SYN2_9DINO